MFQQIRVGQEPEIPVNTGDEETNLPELQRVDSNDGKSVTPTRSIRRTVRRASTEGLLDQKLSRSEYRAKIVEEIITTERTYIKYLEDVVEVMKLFSASVTWSNNISLEAHQNFDHYIYKVLS